MNLNEPENDTQYVAWCLEAAFLSTQPTTRMCYSLAYVNVSAREGHGRNQQFWLTLAQQVVEHFNLGNEVTTHG